MLVVHPIAGGQALYYLDGRAHGWWIGGGADDLGLRGEPDEAALPAVLAGRRPGGEVLLARIPKNRRSGFDLILAAPKSVSLLAALGDGSAETRIVAAHEQAIRSTVDYLQHDAALTRRRDVRIPTTGLVAAAFTHRLSGANDPHLHTHLVVANLVHGVDGRWSALDGRALYRYAPAAGAVFQSALRYHLAEQGLRFRWAIDHHGLGDVVGVPRPAIDAASVRQRQVRSEVAAGLAGRVGRATAAGRTRRAIGGAPDRAWDDRVAAAGLDRGRAGQLIVEATRQRSIGVGGPPTAPDGRALSSFLASHHSRFQRGDVVKAAAALARDGAPAETVERAADAFLTTAVVAGRDAWTTPGLRQLEDRILGAAVPATRSPTGVGMIREGTPEPEQLTDTGRQAVARLTRGGAPVDLLGGTFMGQAEVLGAARSAWEASGHRVALFGRTERAQARWQAVTGLGPPPPPPSHATVVVIDAADRWSTPQLHQVVADATARRAKVVLLDGGSQPRRRQAESPAIEVLRATLAPIDPGPPGIARGDVDREAVAPTGRDGSVRIAPSVAGAVDHLVEDWSRQRATAARARMVALGPEEAEHLNARARVLLERDGALAGPAIEIGGRAFQRGDDVAARGRDARLGGVAGGTVGQVTAVDPDRLQATIQWPGRRDPVTIGGEKGAIGGWKGSLPLTHGYATTPAYLRDGHDGPLLSLGDTQAVAPRLHPDRIYQVLPLPAPDRTRNEPSPLSALLAEAARPQAGPAARRQDAERPLSELAAERDRLADHLLATMPADPRPELRRLGEEQAWLASRPDAASPSPSPSPSFDARRAALTAAADHRQEWLAVHSGQLQRWADLSGTIAWREAALGLGAEIRPTAAVEAHLGPPPIDAVRRPLWRRAAEAIEAHREQSALPDQPLDLTSKGGPELRVLAATRAFERAPARDRALDRLPP